MIEDETSLAESSVNSVATPEGTELSSNQEASTNGEQQATWKYADNVMGEGEPPDWFIASKYKSVEEQAKAYNEARKKLGAMAEGAPNDYVLEYEALGIKADDPALTELKSTFKELNIPQDAFAKIISKYVDVQKKNLADFEQARTAAWEQVGKDTASKVQNWLNNNLSDTEREVAKNWIASVDDIKVLEKIRGSAPKSAPPTANQAPAANNYESYASIQSEIERNWKKFKEDPIYNKQMDTKRREARMREEQS